MPTEVNLNGSDSAVAQWIWNNLLPESGQASWLQGELLRVIEKLRWEAQSNGNINWDACFLMFVDFLGDHLLSEPLFSEYSIMEIAADLDRLRHSRPADEFKDEKRAGELPYVDDDLYDRLTAYVVNYCRLNPKLVSLHYNPAQYR